MPLLTSSSIYSSCLFNVLLSCATDKNAQDWLQ